MKVKITLDKPGLREVMRSAGVQAMTDEAAQRIASAAGENFHAKAVPHKWTARSYATWSNVKGWRQEAKDGRLSRAFGGAVAE